MTNDREQMTDDGEQATDEKLKVSGFSPVAGLRSGQFDREKKLKNAEHPTLNIEYGCRCAPQFNLINFTTELVFDCNKLIKSRQGGPKQSFGLAIYVIIYPRLSTADRQFPAEMRPECSYR